MKLFERITLPRIFDVSLSAQELFKIKTPYEQLEFLVIDFSDVG